MRFYNYVRSLFPSKLPVGMTDFHGFADSIIDLTGEYADRESMKFAISSMIIHLGPQKSSVPKNYFVRSLRKVAANQVAQAFLIEIKEKQKAELEAQQKKAMEDAEKAKQQADTSPEATTSEPNKEVQS